MLKSILVGLDGSRFSENAVEIGLKIAGKLGASITGLGIIDTPSIFDSSPGVAGSMHYKEAADKAQYEHAKKRVGGYIEAFEHRCGAAGATHDSLLIEGSPEKVFVRQAVEYDLLILGQKTYFQSEQSEDAGDTLIVLLKETPRPVLVVPEKARIDFGKPAVVAFDGSLPSARALQLFTLLSFDDPTNEIHLVTVGDNEASGKACQAGACHYLERWFGRKPVCALLKGDRSAAIMRYAQEKEARLVVMGAYGVSGLKKFFFGSVTRDILDRSDRVLFLYH